MKGRPLAQRQRRSSSLIYCEPAVSAEEEKEKSAKDSPSRSRARVRLGTTSNGETSRGSRRRYAEPDFTAGAQVDEVDNVSRKTIRHAALDCEREAGSGPE